MATFPSSLQKKPTGYSQAELQSTISRMKISLQIVEQKSLSLNGKINHLKKSSSNDPLQQLQTDTIVDMYQIVRGMRVFLIRCWLCILPIRSLRLHRNQLSPRGAIPPLQVLT